MDANGRSVIVFIPDSAVNVTFEINQSFFLSLTFRHQSTEISFLTRNVALKGGPVVGRCAAVDVVRSAQRSAAQLSRDFVALSVCSIAASSVFVHSLSGFRLKLYILFLC
jgi:hypothetical protein